MSLQLVDSPSFDPISLAKINVAGVSDLVAGVGDYYEMAFKDQTRIDHNHIIFMGGNRKTLLSLSLDYCNISF